ncbi:MAG: divalent-cation tolerance protein CutA [Candidatus Omnitrophota bacterium]|nr:MAG: divalent-cation tolerance protein CutA [Candidatus Omnitrophota bacterium]
MALAVFVTIPSKDSEKLTKILLEKRVCACVNILSGVKSYFWWEGKIDTAQECLLVIKTKDSLFSRLKKVVKANHPYEVPEIIAFKIDKINKEYLNWLLDEVK